MCHLSVRKECRNALPKANTTPGSEEIIKISYRQVVVGGGQLT